MAKTSGLRSDIETVLERLADALEEMNARLSEVIDNLEALVEQEEKQKSKRKVQ